MSVGAAASLLKRSQ